MFLTVRLVAHNVSSESGVVLDLGEKRVLWVWGLRLRSLRAVQEFSPEAGASARKSARKEQKGSTGEPSVSTL